jgi:AraC-type DNA-binding domain-containing proteins
MDFKQLNIDNNLREYFEYDDESFPFGVWTDSFVDFFDRTLVCHWHDSFELGIVVSGKIDYYINGKQSCLCESDCVFVNANALHMAKQSDSNTDAVMFVITFRPLLLARNKDCLIYQKYLQPVLDSSIRGFKIDTGTQSGKNVMQGLKRIYALNSGQHGYELECLSLISQIWYDIIGCISEYNPLPNVRGRYTEYSEIMKLMLSFIHEHYKENISVADIVKHANISRSECFRSFQRFTNKTPVEYINEYRLTHAAIMLKESKKTITEIGIACGFSNSSYFGKLFKTKYSFTPLQYRHRQDKYENHQKAEW